ncbi:hypothetical protein D3C81_1189820 [compost metagenome]
MGAHVCNHGLAAVGQAVADGIGHQVRHGQAGRAHDHRHRVIARTLEQDPDRGTQQIRLQPGKGHVDRVAVKRRVVSLLQGAQLRRGGFVRRRRLEAGDAQAVGHQRAGAAGRGQDRDAVARQLAPGSEGGGHVEQVGEGLRAHHADLFEQRVVHAVRTGQRAGM